VRANLLEAQMKETVGKLDFSFRLEKGALSGVSAGLRWRDLKANSVAYRSQVTPTTAEIQPYVRVRPGDFLSDVGGSFPRPFLTTVADNDYILQRSTGGAALQPNSARDYDLKERALAAYVMADMDGEAFGVNYVANVGLRSVRTDFAVDTKLNGVTPVRDENRYNNVLPSANIVFNMTPDFLLRMSASRTMQQAGIAELAPSIFVNTSNRTASGGNANLRPTLSDNFDVSFELYGKRSALLSGAVFSKRVQDVQADGTELRTFAGYEQLGPIPYSRPDNVGSARVRGFELGVQRFFEFLPAPLDGLGVIANYTFSDGEGDGGKPLIGLSKRSYNLIGLFERGPFSARLAYNARDKAAFSFTQGRPDYVGARSQLDFQLGYELSKGVSIQIQAQNLNPKKSATVEYSDIGPVALNSYALSETRYSVGLRAKF
jgi:iron complex outermembrane receptor protein